MTGVRQRIRRALRPRQRRQAQIALAQLGDDLREWQQPAAFQRPKLILADLRAARLHGDRPVANLPQAMPA